MRVQRWWLAAVLCLATGAASPPAVPPSATPPAIQRPPGIGSPIGSVELGVSDTKADAFLHDLADFADSYHLQVTGDPAGLSIDGREVLLVWFNRPDGLTVLVTDATQAGRMQAFFYVGPGGFPRDQVVNVMQGYHNKMSGYPAFAK